MLQPVAGQHRIQPVARPRRPARNDNALLIALKTEDMRIHRIEQLVGLFRAFQRKIAPDLRAEIDLAEPLPAFSGIKGRKKPDLVLLQSIIPLGITQEHLIDRHWLIRRRAEGSLLKRQIAGLVMILNLLETLAARIAHEMVEGNDRVRHIVEQFVQVIVKQRQPVFRARIAHPCRDGFI